MTDSTDPVQPPARPQVAIIGAGGGGLSRLLAQRAETPAATEFFQVLDVAGRGHRVAQRPHRRGPQGDQQPLPAQERPLSVDESTTPNLSRPEPPALEVGSPAAAALHRIWSGCRTAEVVERSRSGRIEAVVAIASQLAARTDLSVNVDAMWHDDRVELAWAFAHHLPRTSIGCPKATHPRQPPEGVGPFPDGPATVRLGSMGTHRRNLDGGLMPLETTTTRAVTVVFADHEDDRLQGAAWAADARIVVVAPCSVVPMSWPVDEFRLGDVPLDIVVAGAPVDAR